ncbi:MAG: hypothetical protein C0613_04960 [Desulfobulbaceae bacterium]|nr:MAG: hypothetical protein C0613_04960 [Desulfobulbaceae bacterium]
MTSSKESCSTENLQGVANELRSLAGQIESGRLTVGGVGLSLCEAVSLKVKQKLVGGRVKVELSLTASLAEHAAPAASSKKSSSSPAAGAEQRRRPPSKNKKPRPYEEKKRKKQIARLWREISRDITAATAPAPAVVAELLSLCRQYGEAAAHQWQPLWQESVEGMERLVEQARQGDFQAAARLVDAVNAQKKSCHRRFK